ncbi:hypothetical protein JVT61DRAFT_11637 [Boletus reticuloceps]|uniref:Uncharacterized protein n=1 Tax=Boletus reticuloceps TaxID=495285 RepID=A0A8I3ABG0_9AGAM|nr:hypothetical protein JVT61DRAFT_11637 [Boletus reticuloceps]
MNEILTVKNEDGIIQTYFDIKRPRINPIVCVNVLTFFYTNGRGSELRETFDWIYEVLKNRAYTKGTLYYHGPDTFLYSLSRFFSVSIYARRRLGQLFAKRVAEHFGAEGDALAVVDLCDSRDSRAAREDAGRSWIVANGMDIQVRPSLGTRACGTTRSWNFVCVRLTRAHGDFAIIVFYKSIHM